MDKFEFNVDEKLRPSIERQMTGSTALDRKIAAFAIPTGFSFSKLIILSIRKYRKIAPLSLRNRCVFEPSCSHYSELAIRQHGALIGSKLTVSRLRRCKDGNGGIDLTNLNME